MRINQDIRLIDLNVSDLLDIQNQSKPRVVEKELRTIEDDEIGGHCRCDAKKWGDSCHRYCVDAELIGLRGDE